jgi:hypothetical protein
VVSAYSPSYLGDEIRRITVHDQPRQKCLQDPISMEKSWAWWCVPVIPAMVLSISRIMRQACLGKKQDPISKITQPQQKKKKCWNHG